MTQQSRRIKKINAIRQRPTNPELYRGPNNGEGHPVALGYVTSVAGIQSVSLPANLPDDAKAVRVVMYEKSGTDGPERFSFMFLKPISSVITFTGGMESMISSGLV